MVNFIDSISFDILDYALLAITIVISVLCLYSVLRGKTDNGNRICLFGVALVTFALALRVLNNLVGFSVMTFIGSNEVDVSYALVTLTFLIGLIMVIPTIVIVIIEAIQSRLHKKSSSNVKRK